MTIIVLSMLDTNQGEHSSAVRFGEYEVDPRRGVLSRRGVPLKLQPQPFRVLELLVARAPQIVTREELSAYVWGSGVFVDLDQNLNFCIRQIRSVLNDSAANPKFVDTLPKQGYRFIGPVLREPLPLVESGLVVETPQSEHARVALPAGRTRPAASIGRLRWGAAAAVVLAIVAGVLVWSGVVRARSRQRGAAAGITSVAVLPLDNLSGDEGQDYLADGMTDELTTMLAKNSTLRVVSRTSAMQYKGARRPVGEIAKELGVDGILEGSIARSDGKVHMTVQLIEARTDTHVWAESYERDAKDTVSLPYDAAQTIARRLNRAVLQKTSAPYVNSEAHDDYLRGRYDWFVGKNEEAGKYFRRATELQPDYALGWAGMSYYYGQGAFDELDPREALPKEETTARRAVELDNSLPEAHLALSAALFFYRWNWAEADSEVSRALELNPGLAEAHHLRAKLYSVTGRYDEAIQSERRATELDPFQRPYAMGMILSDARQDDAAIRDTRSRLEATPGDAGLHFVLCEALRRKGELAESAQEWEKATLLSGDKGSADTIRRTFASGGYRALLLWQVRELTQQSAKHYVSPMQFALQYGQLGRREETLAMLEESYRQRAPYLLWIQTEPAYDYLHSEERYKAIVRGMGLPE